MVAERRENRAQDLSIIALLARDVPEQVSVGDEASTRSPDQDGQKRLIHFCGSGARSSNMRSR